MVNETVQRLRAMVKLVDAGAERTAGEVCGILNEYKQLRKTETFAAWERQGDRIFKRDGYRCQRCERKTDDLTTHHILARSEGGKDSDNNLITLCVSCHDWVELNGHLPWNQLMRTPRRALKGKETRYTGFTKDGLLFSTDSEEGQERLQNCNSWEI